MTSDLKKVKRKQYEIIVTETVQGSFTIIVNNKEEAVRLARSLYRSGQLVLEPGELIKVKFEAQVTHRGTHR